MATVVSHLTVFFLAPFWEHQEQRADTLDSRMVPLKMLRKCLHKYIDALQLSQTGLTRSYVAVIAGPRLERVLQHHSNTTHHKAGGKLGFGRWHLLTTHSSGHQTPGCKREQRHKTATANHCVGPPCNLASLEKIVGALNSYLGAHSSSDNATGGGDWEMSSSESLGHVASGIHRLLDKTPVKPAEHTIVDVHWIAGESFIASPSSSVELFGALLRLKEWHSAHIEVIISESGDVGSQLLLGEWQEAVGIDGVCRLSEWRPPSSILWRGAICFTEHKNLKQAFNHRVSFPGFSLSLATDIDLPPNVSDLLAAVGLGPYFHPSHIEVMQVIDVSTLPLFWLSPLHCKLSLATTNDNSPSKNMLRHLFGTTHVHSEEGGETKKPAGRSTADWIEYVQGKEEDDIGQNAKASSPLLAYETGPFLLLTQDSCSDQSNCIEKSCDGWFLWKPSSIDAGLFAHLKRTRTYFNEKESEMSVPLMGLPILNPGNQEDTSNMKLLPCSRDDFFNHLFQLPHELEHPPSDWPEIKALKTHEWIQRKMIRRLATPDLMFGRMVAPPPTTITMAQLDSVNVGDVLSSFTESGSPATSELSPIAMSDPSKLTKVHNPVEADVSFSAIISTTPSSKKQYHGVNYCLTTDDSSLDARLTRIQQRCLLSERSSNCSSVVTPQAERARQQSRRMRATQTHVSDQAEKIEEQQPAEQKGKDDTMAVEVKETGTGLVAKKKTASMNVRSTPRKRVVLRYGGSPYKSGPIKITRSPVVKISRAKHRRSISLHQRDNSSVSEHPPLQTKSQKLDEAPTSSSKVIHVSAGLNTREDLDSTEESNVLPMEVNIHTGIEAVEVEPHLDAKENCVDNSSEMNQADTPSVPYQPTTLEKTDSQSENAADQPASLETNGALRRSPRLSKWRKTAAQKSAHSTNLTEQRKEKKLKTQLGQEVVKALKKHNMPRSHPCFRRCYARLFSLSKSFLKDLKEYAKQPTDMREEIQRVVQLNVQQVIEFEFRMNQKL